MFKSMRINVHHFFLAAGLLFLTACAEEISTEQHIASARAAIAAADYATATIELKNALQKDQALVRCSSNGSKQIGKAEVWLATDTHLWRKIAIKRVRTTRFCCFSIASLIYQSGFGGAWGMFCKLACCNIGGFNHLSSS